MTAAAWRPHAALCCRGWGGACSRALCARSSPTSSPVRVLAIQKGTRVLISLWDSLMFGRVPGSREISTRVPFCIEHHVDGPAPPWPDPLHSSNPLQKDRLTSLPKVGSVLLTREKGTPGFLKTRTRCTLSRFGETQVIFICPDNSTHVLYGFGGMLPREAGS